MKPLFIAIHGKFTGSALAAALTGGLHTPEAPGGTAVPYGVFFSPAGHTSYNFTSTFDSVVVQFSFYAGDNLAAHDLCMTAMALFDDCTLSPTGYQGDLFERQAPPRVLKAGNYYHGILEYRISLQKQ